MNHHRKAEPPRHGKLTVEKIRLLFLIGIRIVIIEPDLSDGNALALRGENHLLDFGECGVRIGECLPVRRMNPECGIHCGICPRLSDGGTAGLGRGADVDDPRHRSRKKTGEEGVDALLTFALKALVVIMCV